MAVTYIKTDQGITKSVGAGAPVHSGIAGDEYTNLSNGDKYTYTTSWQLIAVGTIATGTVTSVQLATGTGISLSGTNPITTSGTITITNSAPDQTVVLSDGTGISTSGTYPSFTITNTSPDQTVSLSNGTGISTSGTYPSFTITNTAPDQTVSLSNGTGISTSGTYPSFTITNTAPDQTVILSNGTGISTSGTYPSFTITNTAPDQIVSLASGTGMSITGSYPSFTITNTAPDQTVALTSGTGISVTGTYPNFTIANTLTIPTSISTVAHNVKYGEAINIGQAVYVSSADGTNMIVSKASNAAESTSSKTMGLVTATGALNYQGVVVTEGLLAGLDTTGANAPGDPVWLGTNGNLIYGLINKPVAPAHLVFIGIVTRINVNNGEIFVKVQNGFELQELHNVLINGLSDNNLLTYESSTQLWKNKTLGTVIGGASSQYVRGDGTVATFPTTSGGGSSVAYYLNGGTSQGTISGSTYYEMSKIAVIGTGADFSLTNTTGYIAEFITDVADPSLLNIPLGAWNFMLYFSASIPNSAGSFYVELYKYDGSTFTLIADSSGTPELITTGTAIDLYTTSIAVPSTTLTVNDRLAVRVYVNTNGNKTITLHTQNGHLCEIITTFSTGINTLNSLSAQVQYFNTSTTGTDFTISSSTDTHTFNLPTASASNNGKLSSADWTTFNGKVATTRTISTNLPLSGGGDLSANLTLSIADAAADGTTKGAAAFTASDFNSASGVISIDYTNGQAASATTKGFLTAADWTDFNSKKSNGRFGIADSTGAYSVYSTLQAAITASTAGQTVEFFTDYTETGAVSVILKNDVNINGNGHTYTLNNSGSNSCLIDNGVAVTCDIANLKLKRIGGSGGSTTGNTCLHITGASKINASTSSLYGSYAAALIINNSGASISNIYAYGGTGNAAYNTVVITLGILTNSFVDNVANSTGNYVSAIVNSGTIIDCSANSSAGNPTIYNSGTALNCTARGVNGAALYNSGIAIGCTAYASGGPAISIYGNCTTENCAGYSTSSHGISINGANTTRVINCTGYSTAGIGISAYNGFLIGCKGFSTTSNGISLTNGNDGQGSIQTCIAISEAAVALALSFLSATKVVDCTIESKWNNSAGHALTASSTFVHLLISNSYQVANASANCINKSVAGTLKYSNSQFIGATTPVNSFITQGIINTNDAYGNITI